MQAIADAVAVAQQEKQDKQQEYRQHDAVQHQPENVLSFAEWRTAGAAGDVQIAECLRRGKMRLPPGRCGGAGGQMREDIGHGQAVGADIHRPLEREVTV